MNNLEIIHPVKHYQETLKERPQIVTGIRHYNQYEKTKEIYMYNVDGDYIASFPNAAMAERITGVCSRNIIQVANKEEYKPGKTRKTAGGYVWSFEKGVV